MLAPRSIPQTLAPALAVAAILCSLLSASATRAQNDGSAAHKLGSLKIEAPWARIGRGARAGAAYLGIVNAGAEADRLIGASSPVAERVELHSHEMRDGVMRMRRIDSVPVPAGQAAELKPGGDHVMLIGLAGPPEQGGTFPLTLTFQNAGKVTVPVAVRPITAPRPRHGSTTTTSEPSLATPRI